MLVKNEEAKIPPAARRPPINVVCLIPILSVRIPAIGDKKNVVPMVRDPTRAEKSHKISV